MVDILILAVVVGVLIYQLRRVLGERNGAEPPPGPDPFAVQPVRVQDESPLARAIGAKPVVVAEIKEGVPHSDEPLSVNQGLAQIRDYDSDFDERAFLQGARAAFEMILKAYARGDLETLKGLLATKLYDQFAEDAKARAAKGYHMETHIHQLSATHILAARMVGFDAEVTVEFVSEQTTVVRDGAGAVVVGDAAAREEVRDTWVFRRDTRTADPAWLLSETRD